MLRLLKYRFLCWVCLLITWVFFGGCMGEPEATYVDFSDRLVVEQPGDKGQDNASTIKVAVASIISAQETVGHYHNLLDYIADNLGFKIQLVQRKTYDEINQLIRVGQIDLAFICSGPYANGRERFGFQALAVPRVRGSHLYQSYLIVKKDGPIQKLADLRGKIFAFSDPESNTGKLVPTYWLRNEGEQPETFFSKTIYTYSHDNSIMAVATALVDGAAVNGQVWEYYNHRNPVFTSKTRIIKKSMPFGNPPVVASSHLPPQKKDRIQSLLLEMHRTPEGKKILDKLMIDCFITPKEDYYAPILAIKENL